MASSSGADSASPKDSATTTPPQAPSPLYEEDEADRLCNKWVETGLNKNPAIQFLIRHLEQLGCAPPEGSFIQCLQCDHPGAGFFGRVVEETTNGPKKSLFFQKKGDLSSPPSSPCGSPHTTLADMLDRERKGESKLSIVPEIFICQQYMSSELHTHKTMVHELIHAIDQCRTKLDPLHNCLHVACTEVRAENLSGECAFWTELPRIWTTKFAGHGQECVRRRAILSVRGNPNCSARADQYVDAVLERCFADVYPFDRHPNVR